MAEEIDADYEEAIRDQNAEPELEDDSIRTTQDIIDLVEELEGDDFEDDFKRHKWVELATYKQVKQVIAKLKAELAEKDKQISFWKEQYTNEAQRYIQVLKNAQELLSCKEKGQ